MKKRNFTSCLIILITIIFFSLIGISFQIGEYYEILGIKYDATQKEIKTAFKKLAIKYHPDRSSNKEEDKIKFIQISKAYETLVDPETREIYDNKGESALKTHKNEKKTKILEDDFNEVFKDFFETKAADLLFEKDEEFFNDSDVIKLTLKNYLDLINRNRIWFVLFYKTSDDDLTRLINEWKILASQSYGIFKIAYVSCRANEEICLKFNITNTPEILFFGEGGYGLDSNEVYKGKKNWVDIFSYGSHSMISFIRTIDSDNYHDFLRDYPNRYKVLLFSDKNYAPAMLKSISKTFHEKLYFGVVKNSENSSLLKDKFKLNIKNESNSNDSSDSNQINLPILMVLTNGWNYSGDIYTGIQNIDQIVKFLTPYSQKQIQVKSRYYELNRDVLINKKICSAQDGKNICVIKVIKNGISLNKNDEEELQYLSDRYFKDSDIKIFYVFNDKFTAFYTTFNDSDHNSDLIIYRGKVGKYASFEFINSGSHYGEEAGNYVDSMLSGNVEFKKQSRPLALYEKRNKKDDL